MTALLSLRKEFRALLPWWAASAGVLVLSWVLRDVRVGDLLIRYQTEVAGIWAYIVGSVVLGAMAFGHEYTHNTLSALLLQPVSRGRQLLLKAIPLATLLAGLAVLAWWCLEFQLFQGARTMTIGWLPMVCAFCLTPWLTMISRSPLAGIVYSFLIPVLLFVAGGYLGIPRTAIIPLVAMFACVGLVLTVYTFRRLQVVGAAQTEVDLLGWMGWARIGQGPAPKRHVVWALVTKELRLQQVTLLVGAAYVIAWVAIGASAPWVRETLVDNLRYAATFIFGGLVSLLPGALVCAEERRFGTADWHTLLPTRLSLQWGLKVGVAVTLSVGLAAGLPWLLDTLSPSTALADGFSPTLALMFCLSAIYVSSLSRNGLHALLATVPAIAVALAGFIALLMVTFWLLAPFAEVLRDWVEPLSRFSRANPKLWSQLRLGVPFTCVGVLLAYFAARNHATTERSRSRIWRQAAWILAIAWASAAVLFIVDISRGMVVRP